MRIGMILPDLSGGGAERVVLRLAEALLESGHRIDLLLLRPRGAYRISVPSRIRLYYVAHRLREELDARSFLAWATDTGLRPRGLPASPWRRHRAVRALRRRWPEARITSGDAINGTAVARYLRRVRPDMLFTALHYADVAGICGKLLAGGETPVAISVHNNVAFWPEHDLVRSRFLYREADAVVGVSRGVTEGALGTLGLDADRGTVIPNPVVTGKIAAAVAAPVEHPWFADGEIPVVLTVGRPAPQKDHATLVRAFALLRRSTEARLAILCDLDHPGHPVAIEETRALATSLGVAEHVAHIDFDENPFRYMVRAAVLALSSRWEGLSNVLLEAMACGTAVASTDAPYGPAEILEGGRWGPLVPVGDAEALADALAGILSGRRVPAKELQRRAATFSPEKAVDRYEELFASLLENARAAAG